MTKESLTLLNIPAELRFNIYRLVFKNSWICFDTAKYINNQLTCSYQWPLLLTCKKIYFEAREKFIQETNFEIRETSGLNSFIERLSGTSKNGLRCLTMFGSEEEVIPATFLVFALEQFPLLREVTFIRHKLLPRTQNSLEESNTSSTLTNRRLKSYITKPILEHFLDSEYVARENLSENISSRKVLVQIYIVTLHDMARRHGFVDDQCIDTVSVSCSPLHQRDV